MALILEGRERKATGQTPTMFELGVGRESDTPTPNPCALFIPAFLANNQLYCSFTFFPPEMDEIKHGGGGVGGRSCISDLGSNSPLLGGLHPVGPFPTLRARHTQWGDSECS